MSEFSRIESSSDIGVHKLTAFHGVEMDRVIQVIEGKKILREISRTETSTIVTLYEESSVESEGWVLLEMASSVQ